MRASSGPLLALWLAVVAGTSVSAHRLDEYLQAARIDLRPDGVSIDLDLTPGTEIAEPVISAIDRDRDGVASIDEQNGYAGNVIGQLQATLDGTALPLRLASLTFPALDVLRAGEGTIRLHLIARHPALSSGRHELSFNNRHLPRHSVYLANALVPETTGVSVTAQHRTVDQRELSIDYVVRLTTSAKATVVRPSFTRRRNPDTTIVKPDTTIGPRLASVGSSGILAGLVAALLIVRYTRRNGARP